MKNSSSKADWYDYNYTEKLVMVCCGSWTKSHITSHNCNYPLENRDFAVSIEEAAKAGKF